MTLMPLIFSDGRESFLEKNKTNTNIKTNGKTRIAGNNKANDEKQNLRLMLLIYH